MVINKYKFFSASQKQTKRYRRDWCAPSLKEFSNLPTITRVLDSSKNVKNSSIIILQHNTITDA